MDQSTKPSIQSSKYISGAAKIKKLRLYTTALLLMFGLAAIGSGIFLVNNGGSQDVRSQASNNNCCFDSTWPGGPCSTEYDYTNGYDACIRGECNACKIASVCGNNRCEPGEDHNNCASDCTQTGGDNTGGSGAGTDSSLICSDSHPTASACRGVKIGESCIGFPGTCVKNDMQAGNTICGCSINQKKEIDKECYVAAECVSLYCEKASGANSGLCKWSASDRPLGSPCENDDQCKSGLLCQESLGKKTCVSNTITGNNIDEACNMCNCLAGQACIGKTASGDERTPDEYYVNNQNIIVANKTDGYQPGTTLVACYPKEVTSFVCIDRDTSVGQTIEGGQAGQACGAFDRSACGTGGCQPGFQRTCQGGRLSETCVKTDACAYQSANASQIYPGASCEGLTRFSTGEPSRGNFVGCYQGQNCFCGSMSTLVSVGQSVNPTDKVSCYSDLQNDSCGAPGYFTSTSTGENPPPTDTPNENPPTPENNEFVCSRLTTSSTQPKIGDRINFTCQAGGQLSLVSYYQFRYQVDQGAFTQIGVSSSQLNQSLDITITKPGQYLVQCRACSNSSCTSWQSL